MLQVRYAPLSVVRPVPPQGFLGVVVPWSGSSRGSSEARPAAELQRVVRRSRGSSASPFPSRLRARPRYHGGSLGPGVGRGRDCAGGLVPLQSGRVHFRAGGGGIPTELLEER